MATLKIRPQIHSRGLYIHYKDSLLKVDDQLHLPYEMLVAISSLPIFTYFQGSVIWSVPDASASMISYGSKDFQRFLVGEMAPKQHVHRYFYKVGRTITSLLYLNTYIYIYIYCKYKNIKHTYSYIYILLYIQLRFISHIFLARSQSSTISDKLDVRWFFCRPSVEQIGAVRW